MADASISSAEFTTTEDLIESSQTFIGEWNQLVSTTNWEKGRIIIDWREALQADGAPAADYSDEAWSRMVSGVTGQHVGRLRRVYQRFGEKYETFEGLYWSHFCAALDWDDAEMWLEGSLQNHWSVSQMRKQRWETLGSVAKDKPRREDEVAAELDEDFEPAEQAVPGSPETAGDVKESAKKQEKPADQKHEASANAGEASAEADPGATIYADEQASVAFVRPFENLADLPDDLADAFEAFKLAILHHKAADWEEIAREDVLGSLDALKELALAPSAEGSPF